MSGTDELRALSEAATPGPWRVYETKHYEAIKSSQTFHQVAQVKRHHPDAAFIAAAVNYVRDQLAAEVTA